MKNNPDFLSSLFLNASVEITMTEAKIAYNPVINPNLPETIFGKSRFPMLIETVASTIQLPMMSPIANSYSFFRIAVKSTMSSGREVPIDTKKKLIRYSEILKIVDNLMID